VRTLSFAKLHACHLTTRPQVFVTVDGAKQFVMNNRKEAKVVNDLIVNVFINVLQKVRKMWYSGVKCEKGSKTIGSAL